MKIVEQVAEMRLSVAVRDYDGRAGACFTSRRAVSAPGSHRRVLFLDLLQCRHVAEGHSQGAN